ncbi:hypothetical protein BH24ACT4_BH24ACT4_22390 [soil metagenome]
MSHPSTPPTPTVDLDAQRRSRREKDPRHWTRSPQVVVWQADGQPFRGRGYGAAVAARLRRRGWSVEVVDQRSQVVTDEILAAPVHVLSGGETSAFANDPATVRSRRRVTALARRAWADEVTLVGICLGAQLLARAAAPELPRSRPAKGMEAGWQRVHGPCGHLSVAELHYEQIDPALATIDGITVTHANEASPIQAFRWGPAAIGMQFHPEWSRRQAAQVLHRHRHVLEAHHHDPAGAYRSLDETSGPLGPDAFQQLVIDPIARRLWGREGPGVAPAHAIAV